MAITMFTRRTPNTWQSDLRTERNRQTGIMHRLARKVAKRHLKKANAFIIEKRLRGLTIAVRFTGSYSYFYGIQFYEGIDMQSITIDLETAESLKLVYSRLPKRYAKFGVDAHNTFMSTYRDTINAGLGIEIEGDHNNLNPTEIKETDFFEA